MTRETLPARRRSETMDIAFAGQRFAITVGWDRAGRAREVFAGSAKTGTDFSHTLSDACVLISIALQHGIAAGDLAKSLGEVPDPAGGEGATRPASVIGAILQVLGDVPSPGDEEALKEALRSREGGA